MIGGLFELLAQFDQTPVYDVNEYVISVLLYADGVSLLTESSEVSSRYFYSTNRFAARPTLASARYVLLESLISRGQSIP